MDFEVSYDLENAEQFWDGVLNPLVHCVSLTLAG